MNVQGLRYVQTVWRTRSFSAAARIQGVSQPALSKSVMRLESELGVRLFDRTSRGAKPTADALRVLPTIDRILCLIDSLVAKAGHGRESVSTEIRLGLSTMIGAELVGRVVRAAASLDPPHKLVLRNGDVVPLRAGLEDAELDVILVAAIGPMPSFRHRVVAREPMAVVNPYAWPGRDDPVELEAAAEAEYIMVPDASDLTLFTNKLFRTAGLDLRTYPGGAANVQAAAEWARMGLGAALLPSSTIARQGYSRPLVHAGIPVRIAYEAVWAADNPLSVALERFVEELTRPEPPLESTAKRTLDAR